MRFLLPRQFFLPPTPSMWLPARELILAHGQMLRLEQVRGWQVICQQGQLLVSQPGQWHEDELHRGDSISLQARGRILLEGRHPAGTTIRLLAPGDSASLACSENTSPFAAG